MHLLTTAVLSLGAVHRVSERVPTMALIDITALTSAMTDLACVQPDAATETTPPPVHPLPSLITWGWQTQWLTPQWMTWPSSTHRPLRLSLP